MSAPAWSWNRFTLPPGRHPVIFTPPHDVFVTMIHFGVPGIRIISVSVGQNIRALTDDDELWRRTPELLERSAVQRIGYVRHAHTTEFFPELALKLGQVLTVEFRPVICSLPLELFFLKEGRSS